MSKRGGWAGCALMALLSGCESNVEHVALDAGADGAREGAHMSTAPQRDGGNGTGGRPNTSGVDREDASTGGQRVTTSGGGSTGTDASRGGPDGSCKGSRVVAEPVESTKTTTHVSPVPIDLYFMWDQSNSMSCPISSGSGGSGGTGGASATRWDAVKAPLMSWVKSLPADPATNVGIGYFGIPPAMFGADPSVQCKANDYETPDVEIGPLPQNAAPIVDSLNAHMPSTTTPTNAALQGAVNHALLWKKLHPDDIVAVVLVTDGQPSSCGTVADVATTAATAWDNGAGVRTFVIGVTGPGTNCFVDPNPPNTADLDSVARAGGTSKALIVDVTQDPAQELTAELDAIRKSVGVANKVGNSMTTKVVCEYTLPKMATNDIDEVTVEFRNERGAMVQIYRADSLDDCSNTSNLAWYYDNNAEPTKIVLCPSACTQIPPQPTNGGVDAAVGALAPELTIVLGCNSIRAPQP